MASALFWVVADPITACPERYRDPRKLFRRHPVLLFLTLENTINLGNFKPHEFIVFFETQII